MDSTTTTTTDSPSAWVRHFARVSPQRVAIASVDTRIDYATLDVRVDAVARALATAGIGPGDRVVSMLRLCPAAIVIPLAAQRIGAVSVEIPRDLTAASRARALDVSRPRAVFHAAGDVIGYVRGVALVGAVGDCSPGADLFIDEDGSTTEDAGPIMDAEVDPDDDALVLFTSGSTGPPLGVRMSNRNLASNARGIATALHLDASDHAMCILPQSFAYGRSIVHSHFAVGASVYFDRRFVCPRVVMEAMISERCTSFAGVPMTFELLRRHVARSTLAQARSLRRVTLAGGRLSPQTHEEMRDVFAPAPFIVMYGLTEATARVTLLDAADAPRKVGSIGKPLPGVRLSIVDDANQPVPTGSCGYLLAEGDGVALGYLDSPAMSARVFRDGKLRTGDLAIADDDGFYWLVGRVGEMMKIGGVRTSPTEIEEALNAHPEMLDCAVIGIDDEITGEAPFAFVVMREGSLVDDRALRAFLAERLPPTKVPKGFLRLPALPRSESGKVQRRELRRLFHEQERRLGGFNSLTQ